jgi:predicted small lipoprotein YifL
MTILRVLVLLALGAAAAACGQKGPLVLPDAQHPRKKVKLPTVPKPASTIPDAPPAPLEAAPETNSTPNPGPQA